MRNEDRRKKLLSLVPLFLLILIVTAITFAFLPQIEFMSRHPQRFAAMVADRIRSYGARGILFYMLLQVIHVIIAAIPGEVIQMIGGYVYGTILGTLYTEVGVVIGMVIVFAGVRLIGYPAVETFVSIEKMKRFGFLVNDQRAEIVLFVLFLIPGIPKDVLTYLAGLTPIKANKFIIVTSIARFPGILGSAYMGAELGAGDYRPVIIVGAVATVLFLLGIIFQKRLVNFVHGLRTKDQFG